MMVYVRLWCELVFREGELVLGFVIVVFIGRQGLQSGSRCCERLTWSGGWVGKSEPWGETV